MIKLKRSLLVIFFLLFSVSSFAKTFIEAEVDKKEVFIDEAITYKLAVKSSESELPEPQLPSFKDFNLISFASSSTLVLVKAKFKTIYVYAYILSPRGVGRFKIEPSRIKIRGHTYSTRGVEIEVKNGRARPEADKQNGTGIYRDSSP